MNFGSSIFGLDGFKRQNNDMPLEAILAEAAIEGESVVHPVMIDQRKTCAIDKAEAFVIVSQENCLGRLFNRVADTKCFDASLVKTLYECDRRRVTDFGANQRIGLAEEKLEVKS